jgi:6-phosphogluconolactonase
VSDTTKDAQRTNVGYLNKKLSNYIAIQQIVTMKKIFALVFVFASFYCSAQKFYMLIGTYTQKGSKGIYVYRFNAADGTAEWVSNTDSNTVASPSFLAITPDEKHVYAVNESGASGGHVSAFSFDKNTGKLRFINQQQTGDGPCYVAISKNNKWLTTGNYGGGNITVLPINSDGSLKPAAQTVQHTGKGVNKERQEKPHVHETVFSPDNNYLFVPDLGLDKVMVYRFDGAAEKPLSPATPPYVSVPAGSGPRHITFSPNKKFAYVIEEMGGSVGAYRYNNGKLTLIQQLDTHPAGYKGDIGSAEVEVSADGKFLYASNRGDENNIAIFAINPANGKLQLKGYQSTLGKAPRHFIIDPTGNYLLVANQNTDNIVIFKRNKQTGMLQETGKEIRVSMPVCLQVLK